MLSCLFNEALVLCFFRYLRENVVYIQQTQLLVRWEIAYSMRQCLTWRVTSTSAASLWNLKLTLKMVWNRRETNVFHVGLNNVGLMQIFFVGVGRSSHLHIIRVHRSSSAGKYFESSFLIFCYIPGKYDAVSYSWMGYKKQLSWLLFMVFVRDLKRVFQLGQCCRALAGPAGELVSGLGTAL